MYEKKITPKVKEDILSQGVRNMPQNPASRGLSVDQIKKYYYQPEKEILDLIDEVETSLGDELNTKVVEDTLDSASKTSSLSANMGRELKSQIDNEKNVRENEHNALDSKIDQTKEALEETIETEINDAKEYADSIGETSKSYTNEKFNGANKAVAFPSYSEMITVLKNAEKDKYRVGQNIYIGTLGVPDVWISAVNDTKAFYVYVGDSFIVTALQSGLNVGYFTLRALETQKVDLINYQKKTDEGLETTDKTIVGAINEVNSKAGQGGNDLDVQVNSTSIVQEVDGKKVAPIPIATSKDVGLASFGSGLFVDANGKVTPTSAPNEAIDARANSFVQLSPSNLDYAVKEALMHPKKLAEDKKTWILTNWEDDEKAKAQQTLGITSGTQLYKHELIINKVDNGDGNYSYVKFVFVSTKSTSYDAIQWAIDDACDSSFASLAKMYSCTAEEGIDEVSGEIYVKEYLNETYFNLIRLWDNEFGSDMPFFTKYANRTITNFEMAYLITDMTGTIEEYAPEPLQGE